MIVVVVMTTVAPPARPCLLGDTLDRRILQEGAQRLAVRLVLADALLDGLVERRLLDDVRLLGPRASRCGEHDGERGRKDSTNYLHELLPPKRHEDVLLSTAGKKHLPCPSRQSLREQLLEFLYVHGPS